MTSKTKHRLLGLLVIAGLIIIAIPLFHRNRAESMDNPLNNTPPFPDQSVQVQSSENDDSVVRQASVLPPAIPSLATVSMGAVTKVEFSPDNNVEQPAKPASGWVIQLGSFKNKENALRLVNHLRAQGYHAFLDTNHAAMTRVFVGPENKKSDASLLANQVNSKTHLQGIIVNYKSLTL